MALNIDEITETLVASPPTVYFKLKKALDDPDASFEDFAKIISTDPALAARLLRIVNSPFYGMASRVETIPHALNIIGTNELSDLALATSVISKFEGLPEDLIKVRDFWVHSIAVGLAARLIAKHKKAANEERYYLAGMLHDIGRLVIFKEAPAKSKQVFTEFYQKELSMIEVEKSVLGFSHAEVGGALLKEWKLPAGLVDAVLFHHQPFEAKTHTAEAAIIHVADFMVYEMGLGNSGEPTVPPLNPKALSLLKLTQDFIRETRKQVQEQTENAIQLFL